MQTFMRHLILDIALCQGHCYTLVAYGPEHSDMDSLSTLL